MTQNNPPYRRMRLFSVLALLTVGFATLGATADFVRRSSVDAFDTDTWTVWADRSARIEVEGDGDTDLDCYVYDLSGRLLGKDDDSTDFCIVDVSRGRGGRIKVHVKNLGSVYNEYELRVD